MALSVQSRSAGVSARGRGMAGRSSFSDPRTSPAISKDYRGERRWMAEGPGGRRAPLLRKLLGMTEWSKEERARTKVAMREFRDQIRTFETQHQQQEYEWNRREFPELKKKVYHKWGVEVARQAAAQQKNPYYEQQYKVKLDYAEKELKRVTEQRVKDRQKERYTTMENLKKELGEKRRQTQQSMSSEWHTATNRGGR